MHLGFIKEPLVPHNLISAQWSPVPYYRFRWTPDLSVNVLWDQEKERQVFILYFSQNSY
jgi:hypothetical protein